MSNDVEMNDVKSPLMEGAEIQEKNDIKLPDIEFKSPKSNDEFTGLTKEELEKFAKDPFWRKLRLILFIAFWLVWLGMLVVAILIVVLSPKCPKRETLEFWEKKTGYWVDTLGFVDSNGDGVGDFDGLISRLDYIQNKLGAGYIVLDSIFSGQYSEDNNLVGSVNNFNDFDKRIGNHASFMNLLKESRKRGLEIILSADFNSLAGSSTIFKNNSDAAMKWNYQIQSWLSRDGLEPKAYFRSGEVTSTKEPIDPRPSNRVNIQGPDDSLYKTSSKESKMIDLDLTNKVVIKYIKESVKMWLDRGVRGFLLTNVALYVENFTIPSIDTNNNLNGNKWYSKASMNGQIFSQDTKAFLKEIKMVMNKVAKATDKSRCLILDAGNVGFGLPQSKDADIMLQYLDGPDRIADMVIGREFLRNRGWSIDDKVLSKSSVEAYLQSTASEKRKRVALTSATSTSLRTKSLQKLAAPFLLPGNPIIYYGSEIGEECDLKSIRPLELPFYPHNRKFPLQDIDVELPTKCNHMIMPWDSNGKIFYSGNTTLMKSYVKTSSLTVQDLMAVGREETILQLHQKLIKIRNEPSLQWGNITMFTNEKISTGNREIFIREANGFPKVIVVLIQESTESSVIDLSSVCEDVIPILVYPANRNLPEGVKVNAGNIYLKITNNESIHVFKCVS